jgi:CubicO group peptidase (beta-lactamase class C family)
MKLKTANILLVIIIITAILNCAPDAPFKFANPNIPEQLDDGWEIGTPAEVGIDQDILDQIYYDFVSEQQYFNAISLLIIKDGKLVFEVYCRNVNDRDHYSHIQSVTKSVTSLAFGKALTEGYIDSIDQTLYSVIPDKFPSGIRKRSISFRHLLTMTSGLQFDNDDFSVEIYVDKPDDPIKYILDKPMYANPGEKFYYRDCDPHLVSYALQRLTGKTEEQWVKEQIFDRLGIIDYYWDRDHTGTSMGAHGLHLKPRDLAKIGQMILDHGRWNNTQIIDSLWVEISAQPYVETDWRDEPFVYDYGFYWWVVPRWQAFSAWGHGGNFIFIVPGKELVIVMTSLPDVDEDEVGTKLNDFEILISPLLES